MLKKILLVLLALIVLVAIAGLLYYRLVIYQPPLVSDDDRAAVTIMPIPASMDLKRGYLDLSTGLQINTENNDIFVQQTVLRFTDDLAKIYNIPANDNGTRLTITCKSISKSPIPMPEMDESYTLEIGDEIQLQANTGWGVVRGLETILQLVKANDYGVPALPKLEMEDHPAYKWRGVMLDVSRHWIPKEVVLRILDGMATVKMNVFHWHLSDDQGFRVESKVFPKLHEIGSNGFYYTQAEIKEIVDFAAARGIRIVPEFDIPGHSKSWQIAYPELSTVDYQQQFGRTANEMFFPPMDPGSDTVYAFLDKFIGEMSALFPDPYFHIGGDEVDAKFWEEDPSVRQFMNANNLKDAHDLQAFFNKRVKQLLDKHGKKLVGWQEILNPELGTDIVVQAWSNHKSLFEAVQSGTYAILSNGWYLDHKLHAQSYYSVDPLVLPNAVDIIPDSANWKMYNIKVDFSGNELDGRIVIFDKDPTNIYGFMELMNTMVPFRNGELKNEDFAFDLQTPMGKLTFTGTLNDERIDGKLSLALLKLACKGEIVGGSEIPGTKLPKIEIVKPLNDEEKTRVLGGEAAMWSEVVGPDNVESRIWPATAAIAEKLWSPASLTTDADDMYRRLAVFSEYLGRRGSPHAQQMGNIVQQLVDPAGFTQLMALVELLEEVKYYGRLTPIMAQKELYLPDLPLNGIADAARPESFKARAFNKLVENYRENPNAEDRIQIEAFLTAWSRLNGQLKPYLNTEKLQEVSKISSEFSLVTGQLLEMLNQNEKWSDEQVLSLEQKLNFLETGENGVMVAVVPGLRQLLSTQKIKS